MLKIKVSMLRMYLALAAFPLSLLPMLCTYVGILFINILLIIIHAVVITLTVLS